MKERGPFPVIVYVLLGVLAIAAGMMLLGRRAGNTEPSIGSFGPSGLHVFADLLREDGYEVVATRDPTPYLDPKKDVAVAVFVSQAGFTLSEGKFDEVLEAHVAMGGRYIHASLGANFAAVTRAARETELEPAYEGGKPRSVYTEVQGRWTPDWVDEDETAQIWNVSGAVWAALAPREKGEALYLADFAGATNRMIDRSGNAATYVQLFHAVAPKGSRLVFLEAVWGNASEPGLFETIGPWASLGWTQVLVLLGVIAYTLGKPFGVSADSRRKQVGQRELVDAYAGTLNRARATDIALQAVLTETDRRLRRALKMDSGLNNQERNKLLPHDLVVLLDRVEMAIATRVPPDIAIGLANKLDEAVSDFAGDRRTVTRKRKKS